MRRIAALALLVLGLASCEFRTEIRVEPDGSGTLGIVVGMDKALVEQFPSATSAVDDIRARFENDDRWTVATYETETVSGFRSSIAFADAEDLFGKLNQAQQRTQSDESRFRRFVIEKTETGWRLDAEAPPIAADVPGAGDVRPDDIRELLDAQFRITLPGEPDEHNADEVEETGGSTTFIWHIAEVAGRDAPFAMQATTAGFGDTGGFPWMVVLLVLLVAIAVAGAIVVARRGKPADPLEAISGLPGSRDAEQSQAWRPVATPPEPEPPSPSAPPERPAGEARPPAGPPYGAPPAPPPAFPPMDPSDSGEQAGGFDWEPRQRPEDDPRDPNA